MRTLLTICLLLLGFNGASAADIKLLTAGAFKSVAVDLVPAFERETGHKVIIENDTAGALARRIAGGEAFDVAVLPPAALSPLVTSGKIVDGSTRPLAKVGIGVAVKKGAPLPDIGDVEAFKRVLLAARAIAYIDPAAGGTSGIYLAQLFDKMGIGAELKPKSVLVPGGLVADRVVRGEAEIGLQQASEILAVPGATLVGPIPAAVQSYTIYAGGIGAGARDTAAARALLAAFSGNAVAAVLKAKGMETP
jgi:molybdate transport system substrate-binding protein